MLGGNTLSNPNERNAEQRLRELNEKERVQRSEDKQTLAKSDDLRYPEADHVYGDDS